MKKLILNILVVAAILTFLTTASLLVFFIATNA